MLTQVVQEEIKEYVQHSLCSDTYSDKSRQV